MTDLEETITNKKPIKVYLREDNEEFELFDIMEYNKEKDRYECEYGNIPFSKIPLIMIGKIDHIKIESV